MTFDVTLDRLSENNWVARCSALPDAPGWGATSEEALAQLHSFLATKFLTSKPEDAGEFVEEEPLPKLQLVVNRLDSFSENQIKVLQDQNRTPYSDPALRNAPQARVRSQRPLREKLLAGLSGLVLLGSLAAVALGTAPPESPAPPSSPAAHSLFQDLLKYGLSTIIFVSLALPLYRGKMKPYFRFFRLIRPRMVFESLFAIAGVIFAAIALGTLFPFLDRSWLYLLPANGGSAANVVIMPASIKYFGVVFLGVLALCLPRLAYDEEVQFRQGTENWRQGMKRSLRFGLAHCVMGVPIYVGLALTVGGLWFTYQYFKGGVERSTAYHLAYNLLVLTLASAFLVSQHVLF